jgi:AraC-like DNA-binding protein
VADNRHKNSVARAERSAATSIPFQEAPAWKAVETGWRPLFGSYRDLGFSFEWHEFTAQRAFDWARSFHPGSVELCLNLSGSGIVATPHQEANIGPETSLFYFQGVPPLSASRKAGEQHRFVTVEFSPAFLRSHFADRVQDLYPLVGAVIRGEAVESSVVAPSRLSLSIRQLVEGLRQCPVFKPARDAWFFAKALEIAAHSFFRPGEDEPHVSRTRRLARERVEKAKEILRERMQSPPSLEDLAKALNCSSFYLSRQFTQEGGMTMQQYLRQIRMERAAELLRSGRCNVTEAALEVGYNSLSHFSTAFHETFGCCPGLYPLKTPAQRNVEAV